MLLRKTKKIRAPDQVDVVIAAMMKTFRATRNVSQTELAKGVGITFQQIQKYETAQNRVSAARLYHIARFLEVSVLDFYMGLENAPSVFSRHEPPV
jgi:transcriptional regulator with XRE-family HTH domain